MEIDHSSGESRKACFHIGAEEVEDDEAAATCDDIDMEDVSGCDGPGTKKFRDSTTASETLVRTNPPQTLPGP